MDNDKASPEFRFANHIAQQKSVHSESLYSSDGSVLYQWTGIYWLPVRVQDLERQAWQWLCDKAPERAAPRVATSCSAAAVMAAKSLPVRKTVAGTVIPLQNGYLHIDEKCFHLEPPDRGFGLTYCLACAFDPDAGSDGFDKFLVDVLPDQLVREFIQEYAGYTLLPDTRFQRATFWLGGGANGKSTLAEIIAALHSQPAAMQLDRLEGFNLGELLGASLVYVDETPNRIDEQKLKALISGGLVQMDRKYRDPLSFRPTAKWIILGNQLPAISDQSLGFWRRLPVIPFTAHFPDSKQNPNLPRQIIENELSGVLNWAVAGLAACRA